MQRDVLNVTPQEWSLYGNGKEASCVNDEKTFSIGMSDIGCKENLENTENTLDAKMRCLALYMIKATKEKMTGQSSRKYMTLRIGIMWDDPEFYNQSDNALKTMISTRTSVLKTVFEKEFNTNVAIEWYQHSSRMKTWIDVLMKNPSYVS